MDFVSVTKPQNKQIKKFTKNYICFYNLFKLRGVWNKGKLFMGDVVKKRLRTTDSGYWKHNRNARGFSSDSGPDIVWCLFQAILTPSIVIILNHLSIHCSMFACRVCWMVAAHTDENESHYNFESEKVIYCVGWWQWVFKNFVPWFFCRFFFVKPQSHDSIFVFPLALCTTGQKRWPSSNHCSALSVNT